MSGKLHVILKRSNFAVLLVAMLMTFLYAFADTIPQKKPPLILMDMVHNNPGEAPTVSKFTDPAFLKANGYGAKVFFLFEAAQFGINWQTFDPEIFPKTSEAANWTADKDLVLQKKYSATKAAGLNVYCMLDMIVLPKSLVEKHRAELCDAKDKIDIAKPFTQLCIRSLINQMFIQYPQLDGLVIRTGETYLQDAPYYTGNHPVVHDRKDHVTLINLLREEVCVKRNKDLFYRTWDMGQLHSLPAYYLSVTDSIKPHPHLYFSIKHTMVDFWRGAVTFPASSFNGYDKYWIDEASSSGVPFNPCLGIGKHKQIVEVQCQREYEGKAAHVNYIANGVINGFEELKQTTQPNSLNQLKTNPLFSGVWTWSRGGGWGGPYVSNEFWPELNAFVLAHWAQNPDRSEDEIFKDFARSKGLPEDELDYFHQLCLLSAKGILEGQYSRYGGVFLNWTRDDNVTGLFFLKPYFDVIIKQNKIAEYLQEKEEAAMVWGKIASLSNSLHFKDAGLNSFVRVSGEYARLKFDFFSAAWQVMLRGYTVEQSGQMDKKELATLIEKYDESWKAWDGFVKAQPLSPTIYKVSSNYFDKQVGIAETVDHFRVVVGMGK